jgi:hypothetical protein
MAKNSVVFGIYKQEGQAGRAVDALRESGFRSADISVLMPASPGDKELILEKGTKAPEGAVAGASSGALLGGALGWLAAAGTLAIPGLGPFIVAGPIMALLGGVGVGGAVGGLTGALIGAGTPEYEAKQYEGRVRSGHVLLAVHCDDTEWRNAARDILERTGAEDISSTREPAPVIEESAGSALDHEADFRRNLAANHADLGISYAQAAPLYEFGFRMARSQRFKGKNFEDVEPELKAKYLAEFPESDWDQVSSLVLYGWERAGGTIRHGFALI